MKKEKDKKINFHRHRISLLIIAAFLLGGCATLPQVQAPWSQVGVASYYGPKFHGRKTSNGEIFNMYAMTAAHNTLPFGTIVLVTNLENGKRVMVRINDRGPFIKNRIIDLSYGAARKLDMINPGTVKVRIQVLKWGETPP